MTVKTIKDILINSKTKFPKHVAFRVKNSDSYREYLFLEVYALSRKLALKLYEKGIRKGDRVGILSENRPEWGISYFACVLLGAVVVPLDAMITKDEIDFIFKDSGAKILIVSDNLQKKHGFSYDIVLMSEIDSLKDGGDLIDTPIDENDLLAIFYTSGTTGRPKGVMLTNKNIVSNIVSVTNLFDINPTDNFLSVLPLHHTFENTCGFLAPFYLGSAVTYAESLKSYNLLRNMQETKVTIMCGVPLLYNLFYDGIMREIEEKPLIVRAVFSLLLGVSKLVKRHKIRRILFSMIHKKLGGHIRFWVSGGAAIDPAVIKGFDLFGLTILQGYGLTESSPILTCNSLKKNKIGAAGFIIDGLELKLSEEGEIIAKGPNIMKGYYKLPEETAKVLKDGWLYTGDKGTIDKDGFVFITGRIKDIIVSGSGVNVSPDELEAALNKIKGIKESCVLGVKITDGLHKGMEEVFAVIVPDYDYLKKSIKHIKEEDLEKYIHLEIAKLNKTLPPYKRVAKTKIRSMDLPKTSTRKIKKFQVRKEMGI